ncbi:type III polyketide synthase [Oharaeibacter diazotrophicus]|uniref:Putative naringenin-chalcone synthase n=1 Tax=Oharaeibacter diazotrophicus TaxID=1920512 RepID=A0A4R6R6H2_9HYPH|nr:type III polyketide synthase [Oharaeibacter diazotrophicus]TDP81551.1 putative naringenin-chalcone synthase [Oharaeibacter diazotrophicus]BBE73789.1 alpha-pyrone synthesis polyketide synthase-like Pks18 [Pleomorphomonas sp. SM30]GLS75580.1 naringenin-chalcone synthase [Oharaeibacter diazotrophicus]
MTTAHLNRIGTAVPSHDVHGTFVDFAAGLLGEPRKQAVFARMAERSGIEHRRSPLKPTGAAGAAIEAEAFYRRGSFPSTGERMRLYAASAPDLAVEAVAALGPEEDLSGVTHLIVVSCTGFTAPGLDLELVARLGLDPGVERTIVGFMGCYAGINALRLARHIVRSDAAARVLVVCLELCTLHLQETDDLEQVLSFLVFGDGCAAALVSAEPTGIALDRFRTLLSPEDPGLITWTIGDGGFEMVLSGKVPAAVSRALAAHGRDLFGNAAPEDVPLWAVHPGGRSVLDAVEAAFALPADRLAASRGVLRRYGNMSSASVLFVLADVLAARPAAGEAGFACAFGPGLTAETMHFRVAGGHA